MSEMDRKERDELLNRVADGEASIEDLECLGQLAQGDAGLTIKLREELKFAEAIRQALSDLGPQQNRELLVALENRDLTLEERMSMARDGDLSRGAADELARLLLDLPGEAKRLRRDLAEEEWMAQAAAPSKSEDAFVNALVTRMWAETSGDRFVDELTRKLDEIETEDAEAEAGNVISMLQRRARLRIVSIAAAAVFAIGAFLVTSHLEQNRQPGHFVAQISKTSGEVVWSGQAQPGKGGVLRSGRYRLESGAIAITMSSGKQLAVEGPAVFEVSESGETVLHQGVALATASPEASGDVSGPARIGLSSPRVRFSAGAITVGLDARSADATEAVIFAGRSGVCLNEEGKCRDVFEFEAIQADAQRGTLVDVPYNPRAFARTWELLAGVETNLGDVVIELPGVDSSSRHSLASEIRVFVEKERFQPESSLTVDAIEPGFFAGKEDLAKGREIRATGQELRSYLLQLWPGEGSEEKLVEASVTFDQPILGVIASSERLWASDKAVSASASHVEDTAGRGLDDPEDRVLLSENGRTLTLNLKGKQSGIDQVRVLVAIQ